METKQKRITLSDVKQAQPDWFSRGNKKFFGDIDYRVLHGKLSKKPFLVRSTNQWSDMFGRPKTVIWKINPLSEDLKIEPMVDKDFKHLDNVKDWLKFN